MADTLVTIRKELMFRIGEVVSGTWKPDELNDCIYRAERKVCEDSITLNKGLLTEVWRENLIKDKYQYTCPSDFIGDLELFQLYSGTIYRVHKDNIALLMIGFRDDTTSSRIYKYTIHSAVPVVLKEGVADGGSNTTLTNADLDFTTMNIVANRDYCKNVTDGSRAQVTTVATNTVTMSGGLTGGARNSFRLNDVFEIVESEKTRRLLWVWKVPAESDIETEESFTTSADTSIDIGDLAGVEQKAAQSFQLDTDVVIREVEIYLEDDDESPIGGINVRIETNSAGLPSGTLANADASAAITSPTSGWNKAIFANKFRLAASTTYHIVCQTISQTTDYHYNWGVLETGTYDDGIASTKSGAGAWTNTTASDALFKVNGSTEKESLIMHYARYPRKLAQDYEQSELPGYADEARYAYGMYLAFHKHPGSTSPEAKNALALYKMHIEDVKSRLRGEEDGKSDVVRDVMFGYPYEFYHKGVPINIGLPLRTED